MSKLFARLHCWNAGSFLMIWNAVTSFTQVYPNTQSATSEAETSLQRLPFTTPSSPSKKTLPSYDRGLTIVPPGAS